MKIKDVLKIIIVFFIILNLTFPMIEVQARQVQGAQVGGSSNLNSEANFNLDLFEGGTSPKEVSNLTSNILGTAISVARIVGTAIAIIILIVIACKYMIAAPGERADIKKQAVPFVIGACVFFGANGLLEIVLQVAQSI